MDVPDPTDFYTGIVVDVYGPLRGSTPDWSSCASFIQAWGEPALELGCGDGDPLLKLRAEGFAVEGLDSSADMLAKLRRRAADRGMDVTIHHAAMQRMDLGRTYRSIFLAGPTFNLIADDADAIRALERIRSHLDPAGAASVPLMIPDPVPDRHLGVVREHVEESGRILRVSAVATERDEGGRSQVVTLRYEVVDGDVTRVVERPWVLHWYSHSGFAALAHAAGLRVETVEAADGSTAPLDAREFTFLLRRADAPPG